MVPALVISVYNVQNIKAIHQKERVTLTRGDAEILFPLGASEFEFTPKKQDPANVSANAIRGNENFRVECAEMTVILDHAELQEGARDWENQGEHKSISGIVEKTRFENPSIEVAGSLMIELRGESYHVDFLSAYVQVSGQHMTLTSSATNYVPADAFEIRLEN